MSDRMPEHIRNICLEMPWWGSLKVFFFGIINPKYTNPIYTSTHPDVFSRQALTIAHELLYDDRVLLAFTEQDTTPLKGRETGEKSPGRVEKFYIVVLFFLDDNIRRYII